MATPVPAAQTDRAEIALTALYSTLIGLAAIAIGLVLVDESLLAIVPTLILFLMVSAGYTNVPQKNIAQLSVWGKRTNKCVGEGARLFAPYFPFMLSASFTEVVKIQKEFTFKEVACNREGCGSLLDAPKDASGKIVYKPGGYVTAEIANTFKPDKDRLQQFQNSGGKDGVLDLVEKIEAEAMRHLGQINKWQDLTFLKDQATYYLIEVLTGKKPAGGQTFASFITDMAQNGFADVHDLGITFSKINVERFTPEGKLKEDSEGVAREEQQNEKEAADVKTEIELVKNIMTEFPDLTRAEAIEMIQINRKRAIKTVNRIDLDAHGAGQDTLMVNIGPGFSGGKNQNPQQGGKQNNKKKKGGP